MYVNWAGQNPCCCTFSYTAFPAWTNLEVTVSKGVCATGIAQPPYGNTVNHQSAPALTWRRLSIVWMQLWRTPWRQSSLPAEGDTGHMRGCWQQLGWQGLPAGGCLKGQGAMSCL